jgi:signal transduction histidine kinase
LFRFDSLKIGQLMVTAAAIAVTIIVYNRISGLEKTVEKLTLLRDEVAGKNRQLSEQNMRLAQAQDNEIHLATLKERNRIAREIHDNVGHMLTRSLLQSGALIVINKDEQLREPLESLRSTLDSAMTSIRESVHDLHDDSIDLKKVIEDSISTVDSRFTVSLDCDVSENMAGNVKLCMIGVIKEGLSNAVKHSNGDRIAIVIREHPAFYQLMLEDNGSCSEINESGIGLKNMTDRAAALGGRITFTPSPEGFKIFMSVPK